jgi:MFS transporter, ACS family, D-galactonate transporter
VNNDTHRILKSVGKRDHIEGPDTRISSHVRIRARDHRRRVRGVADAALCASRGRVAAAKRAPRPGEPARSRPSVLIALLHALFFIAAAAQSAIVPLLPRISHAYGLSPSATGLLLAAPGLATLAISMPAGMVADRLGARRVTVGATVLMGWGALAQAAPSYPILLVGRLAFGLAFGILWTTGVTWMSRSQEEVGSPSLGAVATSAAVGMVAGPAIGGVIADEFGLASPFLFVAFLAAILTILLQRQPAPPRVAAASKPQRNSMRRFVRVAPRHGGVLGGALALAIAGAVGGVTQLLVPLQLHHFGFSAGATGIAFSAAAGVYIAVSATVVRLGRRATTVRWAALAALALALSMLPAVFGPGAAGLIGVLLLSTAPRAVVSTICYPLATEAAADARLGNGVVIGLLNGTWAIGLVVAPLLAGGIDQLAGPQPAYLTAIVPGAVAAAWLLLRRQTAPPPVTAEHETIPAPA